MTTQNEKGTSKNNNEKKGFSLPLTSSKPPMPPVKPPKKEKDK